MKLQTKIRSVLKEVYGGFETTLEHQYEEKITNTMMSGDDNTREDWSIYHQVIVELKHNLKDQLRVKELQYKLTEVENPNSACMEVLEHVKDRSPELTRLYDLISKLL